MIRILVLCAALSFFGACSPKLKTGPSADKESSIDWYAYAAGQKHDNPWAVYTITNDVIKLFGDKTGYLMSKQSYADFELTLEYRWNTGPAYQRGNGKKNSGVMYNVPDTATDRLWPTGIQFQVKEGATGDFILLENVTLTVRGASQGPGKSVNVARLSEQEKPPGQWNTILIRNYKGACTQYLNGTLVNEGTHASSSAGRILLQYEGSPIDFRNIVMKELKQVF